MNIYKIANDIIVSIVIARDENEALKFSDYTDKYGVDIELIGVAIIGQNKGLLIKGEGAVREQTVNKLLNTNLPEGYAEILGKISL